MVERGALWEQVIGRKFGVEEGGWIVLKQLGRKILKEGFLWSNNIGFSMGNGKKVRFWKDKWCGDVALCDSFPFLYALVESK